MTKEAIIDRSTQGATYLASGGALFFGLTANDIAAIGGLLIALAAFLANLWFKAQHLKLAREAIESGKAQVIIDEGGDEH